MKIAIDEEAESGNTVSADILYKCYTFVDCLSLHLASYKEENERASKSKQRTLTKLLVSSPSLRIEALQLTEQIKTLLHEFM